MMDQREQGQSWKAREIREPGLEQEVERERRTGGEILEGRCKSTWWSLEVWQIREF